MKNINKVVLCSVCAFLLSGAVVCMDGDGRLTPPPVVAPEAAENQDAHTPVGRGMEDRAEAFGHFAPVAPHRRWEARPEIVAAFEAGEYDWLVAQIGRPREQAPMDDEQRRQFVNLIEQLYQQRYVADRHGINLANFILAQRTRLQDPAIWALIAPIVQDWINHIFLTAERHRRAPVARRLDFDQERRDRSRSPRRRGGV